MHLYPSGVLVGIQVAPFAQGLGLQLLGAEIIVDEVTLV